MLKFVSEKDEEKMNKLRSKYTIEIFDTKEKAIKCIEERILVGNCYCIMFEKDVDYYLPISRIWKKENGEFTREAPKGKLSFDLQQYKLFIPINFVDPEEYKGGILAVENQKYVLYTPL